MLSSTMTSMRMSTTRALLIAAALVLAGLSGDHAAAFEQATATPAQTAQQPAPAAQQPAQPPAPPDQPTFRAGINTVRVDVIVTDRQGNPVTDLTLADFEIQE